MLNRTDVADSLQRKLLEQGVSYTRMRVTNNQFVPEVAGHLGGMHLRIALTPDNYQITLEQRVLKMDDGLIIRGNLEQITTHTYTDSLDSEVVVDSIIMDMANLSLPYGDKKALVPSHVVF